MDSNRIVTILKPELHLVPEMTNDFDLGLVLYWYCLTSTLFPPASWSAKKDSCSTSRIVSGLIFRVMIWHWDSIRFRAQMVNTSRHVLYILVRNMMALCKKVQYDTRQGRWRKHLRLNRILTWINLKPMQTVLEETQSWKTRTSKVLYLSLLVVLTDWWDVVGHCGFGVPILNMIYHLSTRIKYSWNRSSTAVSTIL